jgi:hypothetical protein
MKLDVSLLVWLKGVDLVATTARLTLADKLGYKDKLLSLQRLESYAFSLDAPDPAAAVETLRRVLAVRTIFFNRNKHNYFLECRWEGGHYTEGAPGPGGGLNTPREKDLDSQGGASEVILTGVRVAGDSAYRTEVLVEDVEKAARTALARRLESALALAPVEVSELGTRWYLALAAGTQKEAETLTREMVVTEKRDRGLLLNPNHQGYKLLSLEPVKLRDA